MTTCPFISNSVTTLLAMPSAATGETLSERASRLLGVDLDTWLSTELSMQEAPHLFTVLACVLTSTRIRTSIHTEKSE